MATNESTPGQCSASVGDQDPIPVDPPIPSGSEATKTIAYLKYLVVKCIPQDSWNPELEEMTIRLVGYREDKNVLPLERSSATTWKYDGPATINLDPNGEDLMIIAQTREGYDLGIVFLDKEKLANALATAQLQSGEIKQEYEFLDSGSCPRLKTSFNLATTEKDLNACGLHFSKRFRKTKSPEDLHKCILAYGLAIRQADSSDFNHAFHRYWFADALHERFQLTHELPDLDKTISVVEEILPLIPVDHVLAMLARHLVGTSYIDRFELVGSLQDISFAILHLYKGVELPGSNAEIMLLGRMLLGLSHALRIRFQCTGDVEDRSNSGFFMEKAGEVLSATPCGEMLSSIGAALKSYTEGVSAVDFSSLLRTTEKVPTRYPDSDELSRHNEQGTAFYLRFAGTGNLDDISSSISHYKRALELSSNNDPNIAIVHQNLARSFSSRSSSTKSSDDVALAIAHSKEAVDHTRNGDPEIFARLFNLGDLYEKYYLYTEDDEALHSAISAYGSATRFALFPSPDKLHCVDRWAGLSLLVDPTQCLVPFGVFVGLLAQVAGMDQTVQKRYAIIRNQTDTIINTATAVRLALILGEGETALEWLEQGRCLVWNQLNQLRSPVDSLRAHDPSLADRFMEVSSTLESLGSRTFTSGIDATATISGIHVTELDSQKQFQNAEEWNRLLQEIRDIPSFERFLLPRKASSLLASLPPDGIIVIFNLMKGDQCNALALIAGVDAPLLISLDDFSYNEALKLRNSLREYLSYSGLRSRQDDRGARPTYHRMGKSMPNILSTLWMQVVKPVLDALGYSSVPKHSRRRRVWWCSSGPLAFLPIHAAGIYGKGRFPGSCVSDFVVSSYTPTISTLLDKYEERSTNDKTAGNVLLISQADSPGLPPIPATQEEILALKEMMNNQNIQSLVLEGSGATISRVTEEMQAHSWVHLACHAIQDTEDVLQSGVHLHDGRLKLVDVTQLKIKNAEHVFLSACQTSTGDEKLSDEMVHLASGMLAVGYRGVVATMWSIQDKYGPQIAKDFYGHLFERKVGDTVGKGLESGAAAYALDYATRRIREQLGDTDDSFLTWVPYVHFGL